MFPNFAPNSPFPYAHHPDKADVHLLSADCVRAKISLQNLVPGVQWGCYEVLFCVSSDEYARFFVHYGGMLRRIRSFCSCHTNVYSCGRGFCSFCPGYFRPFRGGNSRGIV